MFQVWSWNTIRVISWFPFHLCLVSLLLSMIWHRPIANHVLLASQHLNIVCAEMEDYYDLLLSSAVSLCFYLFCFGYNQGIKKVKVVPTPLPFSGFEKISLRPVPYSSFRASSIADDTSPSWGFFILACTKKQSSVWWEKNSPYCCLLCTVN